MLGELGELLPYVHFADGQHRAPGWYAKLTKEAQERLNGETWTAPDGTVYLGSDTPHAGAMIARICG